MRMQRDLEYFLPLRWAFHCYLTPPASRWKFEAWREYLLDCEDSAEDAVRAFQTDYVFQRNVLGFLAANDVKSLTDFCEFNQRLEEEYWRLSWKLHRRKMKTEKYEGEIEH